MAAGLVAFEGSTSGGAPSLVAALPLSPTTSIAAMAKSWRSPGFSDV
jgi:hypothetical protein